MSDQDEYEGTLCGCWLPHGDEIDQWALDWFDNWYGDKSYREHQAFLEFVSALRARVAENGAIV